MWRYKNQNIVQNNNYRTQVVRKLLLSLYFLFIHKTNDGGVLSGLNGDF